MGGPGSGGKRPGAGRPRGSKSLCPPGFYAGRRECVGCGHVTWHRSGFCSDACRRSFALSSIQPPPDPVRTQPSDSVAVAVDDLAAWVSPQDAETVGGIRWSLKGGYACGRVYVGGRRVNIKMHRLVLGLGKNTPWVDHINGDRLDNRRENLRLVTPFESAQNLRARKTGRVNPDSQRRGVTWSKTLNCWQVRVRKKYIGSFPTVAEADAAARTARSLLMPFAVEKLEV